MEHQIGHYITSTILLHGHVRHHSFIQCRLPPSMRTWLETSKYSNVSMFLKCKKEDIGIIHLDHGFYRGAKPRILREEVQLVHQLCTLLNKMDGACGYNVFNTQIIENDIHFLTIIRVIFTKVSYFIRWYSNVFELSPHGNICLKGVTSKPPPTTTKPDTESPSLPCGHVEL